MDGTGTLQCFIKIIYLLVTSVKEKKIVHSNLHFVRILNKYKLQEVQNSCVNVEKVDIQSTKLIMTNLKLST